MYIYTQNGLWWRFNTDVCCRCTAGSLHTPDCLYLSSGHHLSRLHGLTEWLSCDRNRVQAAPVESRLDLTCTDLDPESEQHQPCSQALRYQVCMFVFLEAVCQINYSKSEKWIRLSSPMLCRLNSTEYAELRANLHTPIRNSANVVIHRTISELFLETFRAQVELNEPYTLSSEQVHHRWCSCCVVPIITAKL